MTRLESCPVHPDIPLLRLHLNFNQGIKYKIETATKFHYCSECDSVYEIIPHKAMILLKAGSKKGSHSNVKVKDA